MGEINVPDGETLTIKEGVVVYPIVKFGRRHRRLSRSNQQTTAQVSNILYETITGTRIAMDSSIAGVKTLRITCEKCNGNIDVTKKMAEPKKKK